MSRLDELSAQLEAVEARSRKTIERYEALRAEIAESQRAEEADESAAYDDLVDEVDKLNNRVLDLLSENGSLRQKLAAMREIVQAVASMEARQSEGWQQVGLFHESINVVYVQEQARALLAQQAE